MKQPCLQFLERCFHTNGTVSKGCIIISGDYSLVFDLQIFQGRIHNPTNWGPFVTPLLKIPESSQLPTSTTHTHDERKPQVLNGGHGRR